MKIINRIIEIMLTIKTHFWNIFFGDFDPVSCSSWSSTRQINKNVLLDPISWGKNQHLVGYVLQK
jgi:hypothetical protein